ncbi:adenylyltransferase/cytidyltransferase family protein [Pseudonocardia bannensis]|uniref:Adenylyltransferase/cytidyltransferase family protein n=1 Tax=Pseudonocardia bannensis TaxID=630973 RepID=A0A848DRZ0_9PSEU|nr:adenylyltransferase/cytidyltransferase family protein [Pseudonocardia bannensis]NMH95259.1 adenylyltransferase/cytidyltransferase family protein [Pseudonocardia bannensis]
MTALGCVTGRFQPVHEQHLELFGIALRQCDHLIVAVTNPDSGARHEESTSAHRHTTSANPFTYYERARLLGTAVAAAGWAPRVTVVPFDLTRPQLWPEYVPLRARHFVRVYSDWERQKAGWFADAGYPVTVLDGDPAAKLSATDIRRLLATGGAWQDAVPAATGPVLDELLTETPMESRT